MTIHRNSRPKVWKCIIKKEPNPVKKKTATCYQKKRMYQIKIALTSTLEKHILVINQQCLRVKTTQVSLNDWIPGSLPCLRRVCQVHGTQSLGGLTGKRGIMQGKERRIGWTNEGRTERAGRGRGLDVFLTRHSCQRESERERECALP